MTIQIIALKWSWLRALSCTFVEQVDTHQANFELFCFSCQDLARFRSLAVFNILAVQWNYILATLVSGYYIFVFSSAFTQLTTCKNPPCLSGFTMLHSDPTFALTSSRHYFFSPLLPPLNNPVRLVRLKGNYKPIGDTAGFTVKGNVSPSLGSPRLTLKVMSTWFLWGNTSGISMRGGTFFW